MSNTRNPIASVIVINYNDRGYIRDCLASLLDQKMGKDEFEIIFADNGSTDGSVDFVSDGFPDVRVIAFDRNYGFCEGNNRAAESARGKYVVFLNVDTVVHRKWLPELVKTAEGDAEIKACQSNMLMPWVEEFQPVEREKYVRNVYYYDICRYGFAAYKCVPFDRSPIDSLFLEGSCFLIEKDWLEHSGYFFDPDLGFYCEDMDLALRVNVSGYKTVTVPTSVVYHFNSFPMKARADRGSIRKAVQIVRNRILAFYKNMTNSEFILFLPFLLLGSPLKVREFGWSPWKKLIYALGAVPVTLVGLQNALLALKRFKTKRQHNLSKRRRDRWWLLKRLLTSNV